ncbi:hypothetical protein NUW54_g6214 [Trametes sanguinea]|uniref:Uncharacterized protein n=1 Tax=Trametes sanguinea TaxID=158606 RepID=A0ACC1PSW4_9APHY|nr:hypothetical protein NUW54_g6214 [Trametes sanguinea]
MSTAMQGLLRVAGGGPLQFYAPPKVEAGDTSKAEVNKLPAQDHVGEDSKAVPEQSKADVNKPQAQEKVDDDSKDEPPEHPHLNKLFATLLSYFKARYVIIDWDAQNRRTPQTSSGSRSEDNSTRRNVPPRPRTVDLQEGDLMDTLAVQPSQQDRRLARVLEDHTGVLNDFWEALGRAGWPKDDAVKDRLPENYDPRELVLALERMCALSFMRTTGINEDLEDAPARKKRRTDASEPIAPSTAMLPPPGRIAGTSFGDSIVTGKTVKGKGRATPRSRN